MNDKTTATASRTVLVERAYALGITVPKSWNKNKIETAIAKAEVAADIDPAASVEVVDQPADETSEDAPAKDSTPEPEKAPETPAKADSKAPKTESKGSSAKPENKAPKFAIERLYSDTRCYDVISWSEKMVTVRYRPATEEVTRREVDGSGFPQVWRKTVSEEAAPTYRLRLRKDGTYRMDSWSNPFKFQNAEPETFTDYRV